MYLDHWSLSASTKLQTRQDTQIDRHGPEDGIPHQQAEVNSESYPEVNLVRAPVGLGQNNKEIVSQQSANPKQNTQNLEPGHPSIFILLMENPNGLPKLRGRRPPTTQTQKTYLR